MHNRSHCNFSQKLLRDLTSADKIWVWKARDVVKQSAVEQFYRTLSARAQHRLLWVSQADDLHCSGHVQEIAAGICHGYIGPVQTYGRLDCSEVETWCSLCRAAYRMFLGM